MDALVTRTVSHTGRVIDGRDDLKTEEREDERKRDPETLRTREQDFGVTKTSKGLVEDE